MKGDDAPRPGPPSNWRAGSPGATLRRPYFYARAEGDRIVTAGVPVSRLGHRLSREDGHDDGIHAAWRWDGRSLTLECDRYGFYPVYYFGGGAELCVSPSLERLIAQGAPRAIDDAALAVFLRLGFFVGEDTPFKAIRALPPGGRLAWSPGALRVSGDPPAVAPTRPSRDAAIDAYIERFRLAMARRRPPDAPYALPLSSGRDSRHILLELCRMGCPPRLCLTGRRYPPTSREDALIAPQVARAMNVEHRFFVDPLPRIRRESAANLAQNLCADEGHWLFGVFGRLSELGPVTYHGLAGDVLSASRLLTRTGLDLFERGRLEELALHLISQWHKDEQLDRFLSPGQLARFSRDRAIARLVSELAKHRQAANPISQFYFFNRTRREIVLPPAFALADLEMVHYPFLDRDLCDFLLSLPPALTIDKAFHTDTILKSYPECAHVPFERADARRARDLRAYAHRLKFLSDLAGLALLHRRDWWSANDRLLPRTLRRHLVPGGMWEANRFLQAVLYLSQLHSLAHG